MREIKFRALKPNGEWLYYSTALYGTVDYVKADKKTECQFTGLKDKNGTEIYEGDVVSFGGHKLTIKYSSHARFIGIYGNKKDFNDSLWYIQDKIEVIGNIYQNPELEG